VIKARKAGQPRRVADRPPSYLISQKMPVGIGIAAVVLTLLITAISRDPLALAGLLAVPAAFGWAGLRLARTGRALSDVLPLEHLSRAICDAYAELGDLTEQAARSLAIEPRASGYLRCYLRSASSKESERFSRALDQALAPAGFPRYLISRLVPGGQHGPLRPLARLLRRRPPFGQLWVAVPDDLGRAKHRAQVYARCWERWLGPSELQFTQRTEAGRQAVAGIHAQAADYQTSSRRIWV
jgi:hypothetical protein